MRRYGPRALAAAMALPLWTGAPLGAAEPLSEQAFMKAAHDNCSRVEGRDAKSCDCEQKVIKDRLGAEDKEMAYYYWTDKAKFAETFEQKRQADPKWQEGFSERFALLQALVTAACGA
jgi:hypothetical protein